MEFSSPRLQNGGEGVERRPVPTEAQLVERFQGGDAAALEQLLTRHRLVLERFAMRWLPTKLRRRVSCADLLQDVRMVALRKGASFEYRGEGSVRNWLLRILEFEVRNQVRHEGAARRDAARDVTRGARPDTGYLIGDGPSPSQVAIASELAGVAREAMEELPPHYREVLRMTREEGVPLREVAERIDRSYEATKKLYARALARFTREFEARRGGRSDDGAR